jgi:outer membrane biosynthesis protein TonB
MNSEYAVPPEPILPLASPVYPKNALGSYKGTVTVGIRINIDRTGMVSGIEPSLVVFSTPNSYDRGFREAVETAVRQWHFLPARLLRPSTLIPIDGKEAAPMQDSETIDWSVDVAFTFTASGDVLSGLPGKGRAVK